VVKISDFPVYEGPIPIDEVRNTHKRILDKVETFRRRSVRTDNASVDEASNTRSYTRADVKISQPDFADSPFSVVVKTMPDAYPYGGTAEIPGDFGQTKAPASDAASPQQDAVKTNDAPSSKPARKRRKTRRRHEQHQDAAQETEAQNKAGEVKAGEQGEDAARQVLKVKIPIAVKLVGIVTILLVLSLGAITTLCSILVSADVRLTAEDNNFSINRRTADAIQSGLRGIRAAVTVFYYDLETIRLNILPDSTEAEQAAVDYFFTRNPHIAAIGIDGDSYFTNAAFFREKGGDDGMARSWSAIEGFDFEDDAPDLILLQNATPFFGFPVLVMRLPLGASTAEVFFTSERLNELLGKGDNISFLLNEAGDVLLHSNFDILLSGANFRHIPFVKNTLANTASNIQSIYAYENGVEYFGAVQHLNIGDATLITIIRTSVVFGGIMDTTIRNIVISIIVLTLSIIAVILFSRTISKPLHSLTEAVTKLEKGDYDLRLSVSSNDELGVLTENFIGMGNSLENFEKFTNKTIVKLAKQGSLARTGVNKKTTVCFALIRDFHQISDGLDAAAIVDFVNDYLRLMVPCITMNGGSVDKFLTQGGVIIMALWGTPETSGSTEDDALNCICAALSMRAALRCLNQDRRKKFGSHIPLIKLGCGINTGEVVAGQIGSDERMEYTVIGDAVNLAARIEGPNDLFDTDILISEETYNCIGKHLITNEMQSIEVKGKEKPLRIFAVVNLRSKTRAKSTLENLQKIDGLDIDICKKTVGHEGPRSMEEVRQRWQV
jgi:adenylate cyclase